MEQCSAIILAGGYSSRMGRNKAELDFHGVSFLQHQVNKLRTIGIEDLVIAGYSSTMEETYTVTDVYPHRGPLSGIHAGLLAIRNDAALVLAVDTPLVPEALLRQLIEAHSEGATVVTTENGIEPLIGVYDRKLSSVCEQLLQGENSSLRFFLRTAGYTPLPFSGDKRLLENCNTPEDYRRVVEMI